MLAIAFVAAVIAAACNAGSSVLQRLATGTPSVEKLFSGRLFLMLWVNKRFVAGFGLQVAAFIAQAAALGNGPLSIVEPLLTSDLIFLLLFIFLVTGIHMRWREWLSVAAITGGLSGLFLVAQPHGSHVRYQALPWLLASGAALAVIICCVLVVQRSPSTKIRSFAGGFAAATCYALTASFTKLALEQAQSNGIASMLTSWPVYALIVSGIASLFLMENAYGAGPLAYSQPTMEITEPTLSVIIGVLIFGDAFNHGVTDLALESLSICILALGIVGIAGSARIQRAGDHGL